MAAMQNAAIKAAGGGYEVMHPTFCLPLQKYMAHRVTGVRRAVRHF